MIISANILQILTDVSKRLGDKNVVAATGFGSIGKEENMANNSDQRVAMVGIIVEDREQTGRLNNVLHEYADYIIGRMGIPYKEKGVNIISVAIDAPEGIISALSGKIGMISGVSSKVIYSKV